MASKETTNNAIAAATISRSPSNCEKLNHSKVVEQIAHGLAAPEPAQSFAQDRHCRQRHDNRRQPQTGHQRTVHRAQYSACENRSTDGRGQRITVLREQGRDDRTHRKLPADRDIDLASDDHERHADRRHENRRGIDERLPKLPGRVELWRARARARTEARRRQRRRKSRGDASLSSSLTGSRR